MILKRYLLAPFDDREVSSYSLALPPQSIFLHMKVLHDGIWAWFAVPEIYTEGQEESFSYVILKEGAHIPGGAEFITGLDVVYEFEGKQGVVIYSIFKLKP